MSVLDNDRYNSAIGSNASDSARACGETLAGHAAESSSTEYPAARRLFCSVFLFCAKHCFKKLLNPCGIDAELCKPRRKLQPQYSRVDVRRRRECGWRQRKKVLDLRIHLRCGRQQTVVANSRSSRDALGNLTLHHQNGTRDQSCGARSKELQQNIRSDVVRQVSDHIGGFIVGNQRSEIGLENIAFDNLYLGLIAKPESQFGCERPIKLQRNQPAAPPGENLSDRPVARPNLNHGPLGKIAKSVDNGMTGSVVHKKVLPEFWLTFHLHPMVCNFALID